MSTRVIHHGCVHAVIESDIRLKNYRFESHISADPSFCLATYLPNDYTVGILQRHLATMDRNGELDYWKWLDSPYCLHLYDSFVVGNFRYFVTDPVVTGNIKYIFEHSDSEDVTVREDFLRDVAHHLLMAFRDIHAAGFAYINFDWTQVWMDSHNHVFLGGFENLVPIECAANAIHGFPAYAPPEVLAGIKYSSNDMLTKADLWALGVGIFELMTGEWVGRHKFPTRANEVSPAVLLRDIQELLPSLQIRLLDHEVSFLASHFLVSLLRTDPGERLSAKDALRHRWFRELHRQTSWDDKSSATVTEKSSVGSKDVDMLALASTSKLGTVDKHSKNATLTYQLMPYGYEIFEELYSGQMTTIFRVRPLFAGKARELAIKMKSHDKTDRGERLYWQTLGHRYILCLLDTFRHGSHVFFVTELMMKENAMTFFLKWDSDHGPTDVPTKEDSLRSIVRKTLQAMCYLHHRDMVHLNFGLQNILLDSELNPRLADFSFLQSRVGQGQIRYGHLPYRPPETYVRPGVLRSNLDKVDMWALGATLLHLLCKKNVQGGLFGGDRCDHHRSGHLATYSLILDNVAQLPEILSKSKLTETLQDLIKNLMRFRPEIRMSAAEALRHPWVQEDLSAKTSVPKDIMTLLSDTSTKSTDAASRGSQQTVSDMDRKSISNHGSRNGESSSIPVIHEGSTYLHDAEEVEWPIVNPGESPWTLAGTVNKSQSAMQVPTPSTAHTDIHPSNVTPPEQASRRDGGQLSPMSAVKDHS